MDGYIALEDIFVIGIRGMTGCSASALGLISTFPSQVARLEKQHVIYGGGTYFALCPSYMSFMIHARHVLRSSFSTVAST
jgi:hypothetical protein